MSADGLVLGQWNVVCDRCGSYQKSNDVTKTWDGLIVCRPEIKPGCFEHRHPQDFVRAVKENTSVGFTRPEATDQFITPIGTPAAYLLLPGIANNWASTPDQGAFTPTLGLDIRLDIAINDWASPNYQIMISKDQTALGREWDFYLEIAGNIGHFSFMRKSAAGIVDFAPSTVATGFTGGSRHWIRATYDVATGDVKFYTSANGSTWIQLGATVSLPAASIFNDTNPVIIGNVVNNLYPLVGKVYYAEVRNGPDGAIIGKFDPTTTIRNATNFTSSTGEVWTITTSGSNIAKLTSDAILENTIPAGTFGSGL